MHVREWLLDPAEPAVRARALVEIEGRSPADGEVLAARAAIPERGAGRRLVELLARPVATHPYLPKYEGAFHALIAAAEVGVPGTHPAVKAALDRVLADMSQPEGGFGRRASHLCGTGNLVRALRRLGHADDPRYARAVEWLLTQQLPDGGWDCWPETTKRGSLDAWEALAALVEIPRVLQSARVRRAIERGCEFMLERRLGAEEPYAPWRRLHVPRHYYYDLLVGLEIMARADRLDDPRARPALDWLASKRAADGRWAIDAHHPDVEDPDYTPYPAGLDLPLTPLVLEPAGEPSRLATLAAPLVREAAARR